MNVMHKVRLDMLQQAYPPQVDVMQNDTGRIIKASLFTGIRPWIIPNVTNVIVRYDKPDGHGGEYDTLPDGSVAWSIEANTVSIILAPQTCTVPGNSRLSICLIDGDVEVSTFVLILAVWPVPNAAGESEDYFYVHGYLPQPKKPAQISQLLQVTKLTDNGHIAELTPVDSLAPRMQDAEADIDDLQSGKVPVTRKINGKALDKDIRLGAADVGADASGSAAQALADAKAHTLQKIADLINGAPATLDTLKEIADAMAAHQDVVQALEEAIGKKAAASDVAALGERVTTAEGDIDILQVDAEALEARVAQNEASIDDLEVGKVPTTRKINGKALDKDISLCAADVGADASGSAAQALADAKAHTLQKIADLINGAPATLDTLKEIADAMAAHQDVVQVLEEAIGKKASASDVAALGDRVATAEGDIDILQVDAEALEARVAQSEADINGLQADMGTAQQDILQAQATADVAARLWGSSDNTAQGKLISIESIYQPPYLKKLALFGKSEQNGTPTPDAPVEIKNIGDGGNVGITSAGKNLWNAGDINGAVYSVDILIKLEAGVYTISAIMESTASSNSLFSFRKGSETIGRAYLAGGSRASSVVTLTADVTFVRIFAGRDAVSSVNQTFSATNIQIEPGSVATEYEPHQGTTATFTTGLPLCGIPVSSGGNVTVGGQQYIADTLEIYGDGSGNAVKRCGVIESYAGETIIGAYTSATGELTTGAKVVYELDTPTEDAISSAEIQAFLAMQTFVPVTNLYNSEGAHMDLVYATEQAAANERSEAKIKALENAILAMGSNV